MNFPIYDESDVKFASEEGNYPISVFNSFISQLIDEDVLERPEERGVVAFVSSKGTSPLSPNQSKVLSIVVSRYENLECKLCGDPIPLDEALNHDFNDGYCSYHKFQADKDFE